MERMVESCPPIGEIDAGATLAITTSLENTGARLGSEVVRVEVEDRFASVAQPRRLVDFRRLTLEQGGSTEVRFELGADAFRLLDRSMKWVIEPGAFDVRLIAGTHRREVAVTLGR